MDLPTFSWTELLQHGFRVLAAFALAVPIAWEREAETRRMGLRTLPLVAVACCAYILVGSAVVNDDPRAHGRLLGGLLAGIGFIGGGAIIKGNDHIKGTATAASILSAGVLGAAVAYGLFEIAILISVVTLVTLLLLRPLQRQLGTADKTEDDDD